MKQSATSFEYKGFTCRASREPSITGDLEVFYSITRKNDGWVLAEGLDYTNNLRSAKTDMKITVDDYFENPEEYED